MILSVGRDVTASRELEESLRASERRYRDLFENAGELILVTDPNWVVTDANRAFLETVGEMTTSVVLIALRREPEGAVRAEFHDWPSMALRTLLQSELSICLWAVLLAGAITFVRRSGMAEGVESEPVVDTEPPS